MKYSIPALTLIFSLLTSIGSATERGKAYIYPADAEGYATASGEAFHHADYTAGHAKLAFGTIVKVTNIWNGKTVNVRINDRRSHRSQLIRLTHAAAAKLDMLAHGVMDVDVVAIGSVAPQPTNAVAAKPGFRLFEPKAAQSKQATSMPSQPAMTPKGIGASAAGGGATAYTVPYATKSSGRIQAPPVPTAPVVAAPRAPVAPVPAASAPVAARKGSFSKIAAPSQPQGRYWLQFASFPDHASAKEFSKAITKRGAPTKVVSDPNNMIHRVVSDHLFQTKAEAIAAEKRTAGAVGYHSVVFGG